MIHENPLEQSLPDRLGKRSEAGHLAAIRTKMVELKPPFVSRDQLGVSLVELLDLIGFETDELHEALIAQLIVEIGTQQCREMPTTADELSRRQPLTFRVAGRPTALGLGF